MRRAWKVMPVDFQADAVDESPSKLPRPAITIGDQFPGTTRRGGIAGFFEHVVAGV
jgi:hypothetical protein